MCRLLSLGGCRPCVARHAPSLRGRFPGESPSRPRTSRRCGGRTAPVSDEGPRAHGQRTWTKTSHGRPPCARTIAGAVRNRQRRSARAGNSLIDRIRRPDECSRLASDALTLPFRPRAPSHRRTSSRQWELGCPPCTGGSSSSRRRSVRRRADRERQAVHGLRVPQILVTESTLITRLPHAMPRSVKCTPSVRVPVLDLSAVRRHGNSERFASPSARHWSVIGHYAFRNSLDMDREPLLPFALHDTH